MDYLRVFKEREMAYLSCNRKPRFRLRNMIFNLQYAKVTNLIVDDFCPLWKAVLGTLIYTWTLLYIPVRLLYCNVMYMCMWLDFIRPTYNVYVISFPVCRFCRSLSSTSGTPALTCRRKMRRTACWSREPSAPRCPLVASSGTTA